jgi:hypothetical protein
VAAFLTRSNYLMTTGLSCWVQKVGQIWSVGSQNSLYKSIPVLGPFGHSALVRILAQHCSVGGRHKLRTDEKRKLREEDGELFEGDKTVDEVSW